MRPTIFHLLAACLLAAPPPSRAQALKPVSIMLDWYPEAEAGGYYDAWVNGLYRRAGLDVTLLSASPNVTVEPQVALGKVDFGLSNSDKILMARSHGIPLVAVMSSLQHDASCILVHDASPVRTFSDLEGHAIAAQPGAPWLHYIIKKYGLRNLRVTPLTFDYANFLHDPGYIQQGFITAEPPIMKFHGVPVRYLWVRDSGCDPYMSLVTSDRFRTREPQAVRAFIRASIDGWRDYLAHPAAADAEILRRNPAMSQVQLTLSRQVMIERRVVQGDRPGEDVGVIDPARFANQYRILRDLGVIPQDFDFTAAYSLEYLPARQ